MTLKSKILVVVCLAFLAFLSVSSVERYVTKLRREKSLYQAYGVGQSKLWDQIVRTNHVFLGNNVATITRDGELVEDLWNENGAAVAEDIRPTFNRLTAQKQLSRIIVVGKSGKIIFDTVDNAPLIQEVAHIVTQSSKTVSGLAGDQTGRIYSVFAFPVFHGGEAGGIVIFGLEVKNLMDEYAKDWSAAVGVVENRTKAASQTDQARFDVATVPFSSAVDTYHGVLKAAHGSFFVTGLPVVGVDGLPFAHLVTATDATEFVTEQRRSLMTMAFVAALSFIAILWAVVLLVARALQPLTRVAQALRDLAAGKTSVQIDKDSGEDEVGLITHAAIALRQKMIENQKLREDAEVENRNKIERASRVEKLTADFEKKSADLLKMVASASVQMRSTAKTMSELADNTAGRSNTVAAAANQSMSSIESAMASTDHLIEAVRRIRNDSQMAQTMVDQATGAISKTTDIMLQLDHSTGEITQAVTIISEIAEKTNLLALNATIEAARAGEAGRGFAVVAGEVKNLAGMTHTSTNQVSAMVDEIQAKANQVSDSMRETQRIIESVRDMTKGVVQSIDEHDRASVEIITGIKEAGKSAAEVNTNIIEVSSAASATGISSSEVLMVAQELAERAETMRRVVEDFLMGIKAA